MIAAVPVESSRAHRENSGKLSSPALVYIEALEYTSNEFCSCVLQEQLSTDPSVWHDLVCPRLFLAYIVT